MKLLEIDNELSVFENNLKLASKDLDFMFDIEFTLDECFTKGIIDNLSYSGIYPIEIKNSGKNDSFEDWIENFKSIWLGENNCYEKCFTPNIKKKRVVSHSELDEWIPIYIGKSKNIKNRLFEHFFKKLHQTTFSLKLLERKNLYGNQFRISTIKIEVRNYDIIMPIIENELRNKINPILGKQ